MLKFIEFSDGNARRIICKLEIPLTPWTQEQIEKVIKDTQHPVLRIEGDDPDYPIGDDAILEAAGFNHISYTPSGRKVWEKIM